MTKAVIMARGLGTRMRKAADGAALSKDQRKAAATGVKAMIPMGRPFLDHVLHALADAGYKSVCLVIGPEHEQIRTYYRQSVSPERFSIHFAIQERPLGTADAVAAASDFAGGDPFLVINSDNYYPQEALELARNLDGMGLVAFGRDALIAGSNIPPERIRGFAVVQTNDDGVLTNLVEKPDDAFLASLQPPVWISMNCWRFDARIFTACRSISPSPRGEYEIPDAVRWCMEHDMQFRAMKINAPVLDLSSQTDVEAVTRALQFKEVLL